MEGEMNRYLKRMLSGACVLGGLATVGCSTDHYSKVADPCGMERYSNEARQLTVGAFEPQVMNGHLLDLTLWNSPTKHFEMGTAKLSAAGMDKLDQLTRRRPQPDSRLFIQTARDIPYNGEKPEEYAAKRVELDTARIAAVKKYLEISLTGRPASFDIAVHDPAYPGIEGAEPRVIIPSPARRVGMGGSGTQTGPAGSVVSNSVTTPTPGGGSAQTTITQPTPQPGTSGTTPGTATSPNP
jgi:hypothetical protein